MLHSVQNTVTNSVIPKELNPCLCKKHIRNPNPPINIILTSRTNGYFSTFSLSSWSVPYWFSLWWASALSPYLTKRMNKITKMICMMRHVQANFERLTWDMLKNHWRGIVSTEAKRTRRSLIFQITDTMKYSMLLDRTWIHITSYGRGLDGRIFENTWQLRIRLIKNMSGAHFISLILIDNLRL